MFNLNYIKASESFQSRSFKSFRNLWERDEAPLKIRQNDFIVWKQEYPPEIFHSKAFTFQLPVILILVKILLSIYF